MDNRASEALQKAGLAGAGGSWAAVLGMGPLLVGGLAYYLASKKGWLKGLEEPMTEKQKAAITFAHVIIVLGETIERLTERCEKAETEAQALQKSNQSLVAEDSRQRRDRSEVERRLIEANEEIARLRQELAACTPAASKKKAKTT